MSEASAHVVHHGPPTSFIRKHVFSLDHKVIGKQYYALALVAVFTGMVLSWIMRIHLVWPNAPIPLLGALSKVGAPGGVVTPEYYLSLMTMHGTLMVFFVLTNAPFAAFGNYFLPIQIGAEDMAFPRFNMMSFWTTFIAFCILVAAFFVPDGPPLAGWTAYAPLSAVGKDAGPGEGLGQTLWGLSIFVFCIASLLGSLNFIATTLDLRTKGMTLGSHADRQLGLVYHFLHCSARLCGAFARLFASDSRSRGWNEFLHPFRTERQRPSATAPGRIPPALAALVLVLRAP